ncbi:uncharacterized protein LOC130691942 [Daphnia carinata]|uniref:uncharacterized protein LOC130691942 n=1 Tax=Daphnia carinata TaxID=120202 RepID=UPI002579C646|nr:uncharacterized protein LOC130691942 [Daphnia carinata]
MRFEFLFSLIFSIVVASFVNGSHGTTEANSSRIFIYNGSLSFTTFTVLKTSTTVTSTLTSTTTCTTSSAALTTCTIGRRRRGLFYDEAASQGRNRRGLFYNDEEIQNKEGSSFLPAATGSKNPVDEVQSKSSDNSAIPLTVESGFELPKDSPVNRFLVAFGTSTLTSYTVTTSTISLTAFCSSTTGFALCGTTGK